MWSVAIAAQIIMDKAVPDHQQLKSSWTRQYLIIAAQIIMDKAVPDHSSSNHHGQGSTDHSSSNHSSNNHSTSHHHGASASAD